MKRPLFLLLIALFVQTACNAQVVDSVKLAGRITMDSGVAMTYAIRLVPYKEGENALSAAVDNNGAFSFTVPVVETGLYELKYRKYGLAVLLSPAEPECKVIIKAGEKEVKTMKAVNSHENEAYRVFKKENKAFGEALSDLMAACNKNEKICWANMKKKIHEQDELTAYLRNTYRGTYTADVLSSLAEFPEPGNTGSPLAWLQQHFFDKVDVTDKRLYNTPDLNNKISAYLDQLADTTAPGRLAFIRSIADKIKDNKEAQKLFTSLLFLNFTGDNREPYIQSMVQWASEQPHFSNEQPVIASKIKLASKVLPGLPAPEVTGEGPDEKHKKLLAVAKNNKLTLLIFWESDCPHCRDAMPGFIKLYQQYHSKGLEVFAASLDNDHDKWKQFIGSRHLEWVNVVLPSGTSAHSDYFIQYTPTVVLINSSGTIVHRFISVEDLDKIVGSILGS